MSCVIKLVDFERATFLLKTLTGGEIMHLLHPLLSKQYRSELVCKTDITGDILNDVKNEEELSHLFVIENKFFGRRVLDTILNWANGWCSMFFGKCCICYNSVVEVILCFRFAKQQFQWKHETLPQLPFPTTCLSEKLNCFDSK